MQRELKPAGPATSAAAGAATTRSRAAQLRPAWVACASLVTLLAAAAIAYEAAAARVPQHRAALERLIRHETGLDVRFSELSLRWGWYGPEAVFHGVELSESGAVVLRAPRLSAGLDLWHMARSGRLEAGRITLENPIVDLTAGVPGDARPPARTRARAADKGARILARWRGGQIEIDGGTLRSALPGTAVPVTLSIRYARLRRLGAAWSADALVRLPDALGSAARLALRMRGDPANPPGVSGTLSFTGRRLELAGWHALLADRQAARYLPQAGSADLELNATVVQGQLQKAEGRLRSVALEWRPPATTEAPGVLRLERLRGNWQLARQGAGWHLGVDTLEVATPVPAVPAGLASTATPTPAALSVNVTADGTYARGSAQHAPLAVLAALSRWNAPALPVSELNVLGEARELTFEWSAQRAEGARLAASADLRDLTLASASGEVALTGLSGHLAQAGETLTADLQAPAGRLSVTHAQPFTLDRLAISAHLRAAVAGGAWLLSTDHLEIHRDGLSVAASGAIGADAPAAPRFVDARLALTDADLAVMANLLGPRAVAALGAVAVHLTGGRIESADFTWHGPLDDVPGSSPAARFAGRLALRQAAFSASDSWPDVHDIDARIDWHGPHVHAAIEHARSGTFQLTDASADWDADGARAARIAARLGGDAREALAWLRAHPQAAVWAAGIADVDLRGDTRLDVDVTVPPADDGASTPRSGQVRVAARLDGGELRALSGLPPIAALHGLLTFGGGHLQHSTLTGQWLGGPVSLGVGEQREHDSRVLAISARGVLSARQAVQAAGGSAADAQLAGSAEWSALLTVMPTSDRGRAHWQLRADSALVGVASALPEPLGKPASSALPLHLELQAGSDAGVLQLSLGERVRAVAAVTRSGESWRIERGAVRLAATTPALPAAAMMLLDGRVSRLDVAAYLALWRKAGSDAALPALRARLAAEQLLAGARTYAQASVTADVARGGGTLQVQSEGLSGTARWSAVIDNEHPAAVHVRRFDIGQPPDGALAAGLAAALAPNLQLSVDELRWQGRALGSFSAMLAAQGATLEARELHLSGVSGDTRASAHCEPQRCTVNFSLDSADAAATLAAFGMRPEMSARRALLEGELRWSPQAAVPLATLGGHLHMQLDDGATIAADSGSGAPFALLSVPALLAGMSAEAADEGHSGLRFARLAADYELRDGEAQTSDLHFDGDAEIMVRGRVGLAAGDYDEQAWILRGEERLPAAVRRLGPTPKVAAIWLSLRELFTGTATDRAAAALRLRGSWSDPTVTAVE